MLMQEFILLCNLRLYRGTHTYTVMQSMLVKGRIQLCSLCFDRDTYSHASYAYTGYILSCNVCLCMYNIMKVYCYTCTIYACTGIHTVIQFMLVQGHIQLCNLWLYSDTYSYVIYAFTGSVMYAYEEIYTVM